MKRNDLAAALGFIVYAASVAITPICLVRMADELSFSLAGGGALEAGRALLLMVTLFISGSLSSFIGKCRTIGIGLVISAIALIIGGFSKTYWGVMSIILVVGFGTGFVEALTNPLIHDTHPENSGKYLNIINAFFSLGVVLAVLASGFLLTIGVSWRSLFIGLGCIMLIPSAIYLPQKKQDVESGKSARLVHWVACVRQPAFWLLAGAMFFSAACEGAFTFWSASYIQLHFRALPSAAGIGTAIFSGAMFTGRIMAGKLPLDHHQTRKILMVAAAAGIIASGFAYIASSVPFFFAALFFSGLVVAPLWPTIQAISPHFVKGDPTLLFILLSCAGIPGFGAASWIMGVIGDTLSLQASILIIPFSFLMLGIFLVILGNASLRQK